MKTPGLPRITRAQVLAAFDALGLSDREDVSSLQITGTEVEVGLFVPDEDYFNEPVKHFGELAQVFVVIPVEED